MEKKEFKDKLVLITYGVLLFILGINYSWIGNVFSYLWKVFLPFIIGIIIAFILNILMKVFERKVFYKLKKGKRILSIVLSLIMVFGFLIILLFILIPQLTNAGEIFVDNIPEYRETIYTIGENVGLSDEMLSAIDLENDRLDEEIKNLITENSEYIINLSMGVANSFVSGVINFFVGLVFAIYVLLEKETLARQFKKILKRFSKQNVYDKVINVISLANTTFSNFVKVQCLEACILGGLCFLGMLILRLPYAATISVLVGFTALIPVFGAFIGCIVGAFLIFMVSPIKAFIFILFFLILQQIEGNFIYPHVVGGKIGLPSIWVLVAVMVGGSIGGIFGMLLGVPIFSIIYSLLKVYINDNKNQVNKVETHQKKASV